MFFSLCIWKYIYIIYNGIHITCYILYMGNIHYMCLHVYYIHTHMYKSGRQAAYCYAPAFYQSACIAFSQSACISAYISGMVLGGVNTWPTVCTCCTVTHPWATLYLFEPFYRWWTFRMFPVLCDYSVATNILGPIRFPRTCILESNTFPKAQFLMDQRVCAF